MAAASTPESPPPLIPLPSLEGIPGRLTTLTIRHTAGALASWLPALARQAQALSRAAWPAGTPPSLRTQWDPRTSPQSLVEDLARLIERSISQLIQGLPVENLGAEFLPEDPTHPGSLCIMIWINEPLCLYAERLARLARIEPALARLAGGALQCLAWVFPLQTWEDLIREYEERIEGISDEDPEFAEESHKRLRALRAAIPSEWQQVGDPPPRTSPRALRDTLAALRRRLHRVRRAGRSRQRWAEWTKRALKLATDRLARPTLPESVTAWLEARDDEESIPLPLFFPLLWSPKDPVNELWAENLDDYSQAGAELPALRFALVPGPALDGCANHLAATLAAIRELHELTRHQP